MLLAAAPARATSLNDVPVGEYIRLHVVAEDDGEAAQALKLEVRDACLTAARALLADCDGADAAWARIGENRVALEAAATQRARELGYAGEINAVAGGVCGRGRRRGGGV